MSYRAQPNGAGTTSLRRVALAALAFAAFGPLLHGQGLAQPRVIEVLADHDSRYKMENLKQPVITVKAGEELTLRLTAKKAHGRNRDGSIHGFSLLRAKDRKPVDGWDLLLKPGTQEFHLTAPSEVGEYVVICTVICSQDHEGMSMKFFVEP
jgi:heme/copper-type cytochrome/quinol oxidase subunit 2